MSLCEADAIQILHRFLDAHQKPDAGPLLWQLYADSAWLALGSELKQKAQLEPQQFYLQHQQRAAQPGLPYYRFESVIQWQPPRLLAQVSVSGLAEPLFVCLQFDGAQLVWSSLSRIAELQSLQQALADYPWWLGQHAWLARSNLDAGWWRLFPAKTRFKTLPEARFSCHMNSTCCRHEFAIVLPSAAQVLIDSLPWSQLDPQLKDWQLPVRQDGKLQLKQDREGCRFLDPAGQCRIHGYLRRQPFGPCAVFPMQFAATADGVAVSLSSVCGSVRDRLGPALLERQSELDERLFLASCRPLPPQYRLTTDIELGTSDFESIEQVLLDLLDDRQLPLYRRLYLMNSVLSALRNGSSIDLAASSQQPLAPLEPELKQQLNAYLLSMFGWQRQAFEDMALTQIPVLQHLLPADPRSDYLTDILRNTLFSKVYSYAYDLTTANNLLILLYLVSLVMQHQKAVWPESWWDELASLGSHGLLKSLLPDSCPEPLRALLGSNDFGYWALALPVEQIPVQVY